MRNGRGQNKTRRSVTSRARLDPVTRYAAAVAAGKIVAGPLVRLACRRHLDDLANGAARGLAWDAAAARHVIGFFRDVLRLPDGERAGEPFALEPHQAFIVGSLFGWKEASTGYRRFRVAEPGIILPYSGAEARFSSAARVTAPSTLPPRHVSASSATAKGLA